MFEDTCSLGIDDGVLFRAVDGDTLEVASTLTTLTSDDNGDDQQQDITPESFCAVSSGDGVLLLFARTGDEVLSLTSKDCLVWRGVPLRDELASSLCDGSPLNAATQSPLAYSEYARSFVAVGRGIFSSSDGVEWSVVKSEVRVKRFIVSTGVFTGRTE